MGAKAIKLLSTSNNYVNNYYCLSCDSLMVMFYVKDKVSKAKDGYEVAGLLKEKIGNEEGFFEFVMLKVEPYSKYSCNYGLQKPTLPFRLLSVLVPLFIQ